MVRFRQTRVVLDEDLNDINGQENHIIDKFGTVVYGIRRVE